MATSLVKEDGGGSAVTRMPEIPPTILAKRPFPRRPHEKAAIHVSPLLVECSGLDTDGVYARLGGRLEGLTHEEAARRLAEHGPNTLAKDRRLGLARLLGRALLDPLVILLAVLATVSLASGDLRSSLLMTCMIALSVGLKLFQEAKATSAAARLKAMISVNATVLRGGIAQDVPVAEVVPGDVIQLAAGDMVPGDVRIVQAKDLFVTQGSLTGESFPVEKFVGAKNSPTTAPLERTNIAFLGTSVESGTAAAVVVTTGKDTYLGGMAESLQEQVAPTAFDRGISRFTWLMLRFMAVMVPLVFVINGLTKGNWKDALFFALAVAVGLTPEMLPMIVTVCLSKGAVAMGKKKVIVKRIHSIQNLGAMDVLCTDKTGTLTMDQIVLERYCDVALHEDEAVLALAYVNSHFQTGLKNLLDRAVLAHQETHGGARILGFAKVDEIPFDFARRIMSVVVRTPEGKDRIVAKGAPEAIFQRCATFRLGGEVSAMDHPHIEDLKKEYERLSADGFRVLALATKVGEPRAAGRGNETPYGKADEHDLTLEGYIAFLDPPKDTARAAIEALQSHGVSVKVITGDNELCSRKVCRDVGLATEFVLLGDAVEAMKDQDLAAAAESTTLFARVSPAHKERIIRMLQSRGHIVGFMGDGINDAPALHTADVGISVDNAVDIAKESADMILLEKSLLVLDEGVMEGRKVFSNIIKYVRMGASSNFGNMFSVLAASAFVPFLPMSPVQILANNLLYDISQTAIPTDTVDPDRLQKPRVWDMRELTRFIFFIGPCSSIFDYSTFLVMLYLFGCRNISTAAAAAHSQSIFQTGWFVESLLTQTLIIHVIRTNKIPFLQSRASWFLTATTGIIVAVGVLIPFSPVGTYLGFSQLPRLFWPILALTLVCYVLLTQGVKMVLLRRRWI
jgi:Mg2+-importing ATPase